MKKSCFQIVVCLILFSSLMMSCVMNRLDQEHQVLELKPMVEGIPLEIVFSEGDHYSSPMKAGPFIFNILPQLVIWTEDESGRLIDTVYITGAADGKMRHAGKADKGRDFYRECLPYWASKVESSGGTLPSPKEPYPDTISSATPSTGYTIHSVISARATTLMAEVNQSNDFNSSFTKEKNGWAGQPSLIYSTPVTENPGEKHSFTLIGQGGLLTEDAGIYKNLEGFDTALNQFNSIEYTITAP